MHVCSKTTRVKPHSHVTITTIARVLRVACYSPKSSWFAVARCPRKSVFIPRGGGGGEGEKTKHSCDTCSFWRTRLRLINAIVQTITQRYWARKHSEAHTTLRFINFIEGTTLCIACASGNEIPLRFRLIFIFAHLPEPRPKQKNTVEWKTFEVQTFDSTRALSLLICKFESRLESSLHFVQGRVEMRLKRFYFFH